MLAHDTKELGDSPFARPGGEHQAPALAADPREFGRRPDPYAVLAYTAMRRVLEAITDADSRARLRRVVVERYLALPAPDEGFTTFRMRGGRREYL